MAYSHTAAQQQTLSLNMQFDETYRYIPDLNKDHKFKLDTVKVTVTGAIKKNSLLPSGNRIKGVIRDNIIDPYINCLLIQEANTFVVEENILKRCPITKTPSLENLSSVFFNKLSPLMRQIGCQLISVKLISEGLSATHSKHKISDYTI